MRICDWATTVQAPTVDCVLKLALLDRNGFSDRIPARSFLNDLIVFEQVFTFA
jgi:hypothetical protein